MNVAHNEGEWMKSRNKGVDARVFGLQFCPVSGASFFPFSTTNPWYILLSCLVPLLSSWPEVLNGDKYDRINVEYILYRLYNE